MRERSAMNANPKFLAQTARVDDAAVKPMPNSRKVYVEGSRSDLLVPMREIVQSDTPASFGAEKNEPIFVYDTSGPYTDPGVKIDIRAGLAPVRANWIGERAEIGRASCRERVESTGVGHAVKDTSGTE